jgi:hypothetical protein
VKKWTVLGLSSPRRCSNLLAAAGLLAACTGAAHAHIIPGDDPTVTPVSGGLFRFDYFVDITRGERVKYGDYFTIYDFTGFVAGSATGPTGWKFSSSNLGVTPSGLLLPGADDPAIPNLTWTWKGLTDLIGPKYDLGGFSALSTLGGTTVDYFVARAHSNLSGGTDLSQEYTRVPAPAAPEPGTMAFLGLGGVSLLAKRRGRKQVSRT